VYGGDNIIHPNTKYSKIQGEFNTIGTSSENIEIQGNDNYVGGNSSKVFISGNDNFVGAGCSNISLINCNNVKVIDGLSNVSISNASNLVIDKPFVSIVNPYKLDVDGFQINNADIIDSGEDEVYEEKSNWMYSEMIVDSGEDEVFDFIEDTDLINSIINGVQIDNEVELL